MLLHNGKMFAVLRWVTCAEKDSTVSGSIRCGRVVGWQPILACLSLAGQHVTSLICAAITPLRAVVVVCIVHMVCSVLTHDASSWSLSISRRSLANIASHIGKAVLCNTQLFL